MGARFKRALARVDGGASRRRLALEALPDRRSLALGEKATPGSQRASP